MSSLTLMGDFDRETTRGRDPWAAQCLRAQPSPQQRNLRPSIVFREVTNGFRCQWGAGTYAALRYVVSTAKANLEQPMTTAIHQTHAPTYDFAGATVKIDLSGAQTGGAFCLNENTIPPGNATPLHLHRNASALRFRHSQSLPSGDSGWASRRSSRRSSAWQHHELRGIGSLDDLDVDPATDLAQPALELRPLAAAVGAELEQEWPAAARGPATRTRRRHAADRTARPSAPPSNSNSRLLIDTTATMGLPRRECRAGCHLYLAQECHHRLRTRPHPTENPLISPCKGLNSVQFEIHGRAPCRHART